jgi:hypothetical protein
MGSITIIDAITKITGIHKIQPIFYVNAFVNSVDVDSRTCNCTAVDGTVDYTFDANLMATVDDGILIEPTIGSNVKIIFSQYVEPVVVQYSEIDNITIIADANINITADAQITFNDGSYGGLCKTQELQKQLATLSGRVQALFDAINNSVVVTTPPDNGAGLKASMMTFLTSFTQQEDFSKIENTKITHGE